MLFKANILLVIINCDKNITSKSFKDEKSLFGPDDQWITPVSAV